jgi:hypothetical protein
MSPKGAKAQKIGLKNQAPTVVRPHSNGASLRAGSSRNATQGAAMEACSKPAARVLCRPFPARRPEGTGGMMRMRSTPAWETAQGNARNKPYAPRHERRHSAQKGMRAEAGAKTGAVATWRSGGPATYPMVRRADPRVWRACARATRGASRASWPPVSARKSRRRSSWRLREIWSRFASRRIEGHHDEVRPDEVPSGEVRPDEVWTN